MDRLADLWRYLRATPRRRAVADAVTALTVGLLVLVLGFGTMITSDSAWVEPPLWWHAVLLLIGCALMVVKIDAPVATLIAGAVIFAVDVVLGGSIGVMLVLVDLIFTLALLGSATALRRLMAGTAIAVAVLTGLGWLLIDGPRGAVFLGLQSFAVLGTPLWWGRSVRQQRELTELAEMRAQDQLRLAEMRQEELLRDEREQMARDLHDAIAGHLSAIALRTEAALVRQPAPADTETLSNIRAFSLDALAEMRTMIELLRGTTPQRAPSRFSDAHARERLVGDHGGTIDCPELPELSTEVDQAAYRILQESLTNATKHGGQPVTVTVTTTEGAVQIEVRNAVAQAAPAADGGAHLDRVTHQGSGLGLTIMAERARAAGGDLDAGARGAGWLVRAHLPISTSTQGDLSR